jgi:hypothetical protein
MIPEDKPAGISFLFDGISTDSVAEMNRKHALKTFNQNATIMASLRGQ